MATTPQPDLSRTDDPLTESRRKPTYEEFVEIVRAARESIRPYVPEDWDPVAELIAERRAAAAAGE